MTELASAAFVSASRLPTANNLVEVDGIPLQVGVKELAQPFFDDRLPMLRNKVLVRIDAFSCNYRDKAIALSFNEKIARNPKSVKFKGFGSEFAGEVVAAGSSVTNVNIGDRVMPDSSYPLVVSHGYRAGIVTNEASLRWTVLDADKLIRVPDWMSTVQAAAYSLAAQTGFSMVRKAELRSGDVAIVGSARSNTSLAITKILMAMGVETFAVSSTAWSEAEVEAFGPSDGVTFVSLESGRLPTGIPTAKAILDPFADINFLPLSSKVAMGGVYVTCGFKNQHPANFKESDVVANLYQVLGQLIISNLQLVGNCIGLPSDLREAIALGPEVTIPIDGVYSLSEASAFLQRTFVDRKFGKVVLDYTKI